MLKSLNYLAAASESSSGDIFSALGIDWKTLIIQIVAFVILVWLLSKFVYPWLMKSVDERMDKMNQSTKALNEAQVFLEKSQDEASEMLIKSRKDYLDLISNAKNEASSIIKEAEDAAKVRSQAVLDAGKDELASEVSKIKDELYNETIALVASATSALGIDLIDKDKDKKLIDRALKENK